MKRLLALILLVLVGCSFLAWSRPATIPQASAAPMTSAAYTITGKPSLSAAFIDQVLDRAGSPATGLGDQFIKLSLQTGINAAYVLAIFHHESDYGLTGEARASRSPGNMRCLDQAYYSDLQTWCKNAYAWFPSWLNGLVAMYRLLAGPLYVGAGLTTIVQVLTRWAPPGDNNNDQAYISAVESDVTDWSAA